MTIDQQPSNDVLVALTTPMHAKPKQAVVRRYEAMLRELRFREDRQDEDLAFVREHGWNDKRLAILFALNSVYQEVLGPLQASARGGISGIGTIYPITHGGSRFDGAHAVRVNHAIEDFFAMATELGFAREWMVKNTCKDLLYFIARRERGGNEVDE